MKLERKNMRRKKFLTEMLVIIVLLALLTSCCKHEWADATCVAPQTCTKCGVAQGEALGHKYGEEMTIKEATCTENGVKEAICTVCGDKKNTEIPAEHKWEFLYTEIVATCSKEGKEKYKCSVCNETKYEVVSKLWHEYKDGYCKNCFAKDSSGVDFNPSSSEKKQIKKVKSIGDRAIEEESNFYYLLFSFSDENLESVIAPCVLDIRIENDKNEIVYKAKKVVETSDFSKWSNAFREWILASPKIMRSDIKEGSSRKGTVYFTVTLIDTYFKESSLRISNLPVHSFGEWKVKRAATCGEAGVRERTCSSCEEIIAEEIPSTGTHRYYVMTREGSTCGKAGLVKEKCAICGDVVEKTIPATRRHAYQEEILTEAACGSEGIVRKTCSSCGMVVEEQIPPTGNHAFNDETVIEVTCGRDGIIKKTCSSCGYVRIETKLATGEHICGDGVLVRKPGCVVAGLIEYSCTVCGKVLKSEIQEKLEHSFVNDKCTECGTLKIGSIGPAGGYIFYDCDLDNDSGNGDGLISFECGWRFLESAPEDAGRYIFGLYLKDYEFLYVNGTNKYNKNNCTRNGIGYGKSNTQKLVEAMGDEACNSINGHNSSSWDGRNYAARICLDYSKNGYNDWFLPSLDELNLMYQNLEKQGVGGFNTEFARSTYWSSCENENWYCMHSAWELNFETGKETCSARQYDGNVRPIRSFL